MFCILQSFKPEEEINSETPVIYHTRNRDRAVWPDSIPAVGYVLWLECAMNLALWNHGCHGDRSVLQRPGFKAGWGSNMAEIIMGFHLWPSQFRLDLPKEVKGNSVWGSKHLHIVYFYNCGVICNSQVLGLLRKKRCPSQFPLHNSHSGWQAGSLPVSHSPVLQGDLLWAQVSAVVPVSHLLKLHVAWGRTPRLTWTCGGWTDRALAGSLCLTVREEDNWLLLAIVSLSHCLTV